MRRIHLQFGRVSRPRRWRPAGYKERVKHCRACSLSHVLVDKGLKTIEEEKPWASPEEWCHALAALSTIHAGDIHRSLEKRGLKLRRVIKLSGTRARYGWYANNIALRSSLQKPVSDIVATGTTGNEALHVTMSAATACIDLSCRTSHSPSCTCSNLHVTPRYGRQHFIRCIDMLSLPACLGGSCSTYEAGTSGLPFCRTRVSCRKRRYPGGYFAKRF